MKDILTSKPLDIAFLLLCLLAMDLCKVNDPDLKYALLGLIGASSGVRGVAGAWNGITSLISGNQAAQSQPSASTQPPAQ